MRLDNYVIPCKFDFKSEQAFKNFWMTKLRGWTVLSPDVFEIENEEKEPGFPDVLCVYKSGQAAFFEMKVASSSGRFKMESTQPRFYSQHEDMDISVVVYDKENERICVIDAWQIKDRVLKHCSCSLNLNMFTFKETLLEVRRAGWVSKSLS